MLPFRGFAFLVFAEDDAVDKTLDATPHVIDNKEIDAKKAIPHALHQVLTSIYSGTSLYNGHVGTCTLYIEVYFI